VKKAAYIWCALSATSLAFYAFTGRAVWVELNPQGDGAARFILLMVFHTGWLPTLMLHREDV